MEVIDLDNSEESENSIIEVEVPKKTPPPVIEINDDDIYINIGHKSRPNLLAKDIIVSLKTNTSQFSEMASVASNQQLVNINPDHWTADMIKFYNDDWGDEEHFVVEKLLRNMDKNPLLWQISRKDETFYFNRTKRDFRCWNCGEFGHLGADCRDSMYIPKCHMCGGEGHVERSCPNTKCLKCGNPTKAYVKNCFKCRYELNKVCSRCQLMGHTFINCSDHWRLFHLTTNNSSVIIPNKNIYKSDGEMWCYNCGTRGHYPIKCAEKLKCGFTETLPFVASYSQSFNNSHYLVKADEMHKKRNWRKKEAIWHINAMSRPFNKETMFSKKRSGKYRKKKKNKGKRENTQRIL